MPGISSLKLDQDLPRFHRLLIDMKEHSDDINITIKKILEKIHSENIHINEGISLLNVKNLSMLQYIGDMIGIIRCKASGASIQDFGFAKRSTESRVVLEKIQPLEKKIKYQIDKSMQELEDKNDPLNFKPQLDDLIASDDDVTDDEAVDDVIGQKYVPPKMAAVTYDEKRESKEMKMARERERAITRSSVIADLLEDAQDTPKEISNYSHDHRKLKRQEEERRKYEEDNLTRVMLTKKQKNQMLLSRRQSGLASMTSFGDDFFYNKNKEKAVKTGRVGKKGKKRRR